MGQAPQRGGHDRVIEFLAARGIRHAVVEHPQTFTAAAEARVAAVPPRHAAKAVIVRDDAGYVLAVIPASEMLDLGKLRHLASRPHLRLATEDELAADFPAFEVGAFPPFGELFDCPEFIDVELLAAGRSCATAATIGTRSSSTPASSDSASGSASRGSDRHPRG